MDWSLTRSGGSGPPPSLRLLPPARRQHKFKSYLKVRVALFESFVDSVIPFFHRFHIDTVVSCSYTSIHLFCRTSLFRRSIISVTYIRWFVMASVVRPGSPLAQIELSSPTQVLLIGDSFVTRFSRYCAQETVINCGIRRELVHFSTLGVGGCWHFLCSRRRSAICCSVDRSDNFADWWK